MKVACEWQIQAAPCAHIFHLLPTVWTITQKEKETNRNVFILLQSTPSLPYELQLQSHIRLMWTDIENYLHSTSPPPCLLPDFNLFHMIAVGLSSSILGCLVTLLVYSYCQRYQQQSHDATVIHPISAAPLNTSITNHINKLDKYDSVEAIKVCG